MQNNWDVIVAGGGAAGLSAALMLGRSRRRVLVIDAGSPRNRFTEHMHGVLGQEGAAPRDLLARGRREAAGYGVEFAEGRIDRVEEGGDGLDVVATDGTVRSARALVVATGLTDELPDIPGLAERWGNTVLHCPYCHGWEVREQRLGVLVLSPLGLHQAQLIRQWSDQVTVLADPELLGADVARRLRSRGVDIVTEPVAEILGESPRIDGVRLRGGDEIPLDAVFTAGTPRPHDAFLGALDLTRTETPFGSFLEVDPMGATSHSRVWAIGNVVNPGANVPMSIGAGAFTGGAVNAALVSEDFDLAVAAVD